MTSEVPKLGAMTIGPRFMHPFKSWSLDYRSLFDTSLFVQTKSGLCVPVLIGLQKLGPNEHRQLTITQRQTTVCSLVVWYATKQKCKIGKLQNSTLQSGILQNDTLQNSTASQNGYKMVHTTVHVTKRYITKLYSYKTVKPNPT